MIRSFLSDVGGNDLRAKDGLLGCSLEHRAKPFSGGRLKIVPSIASNQNRCHKCVGRMPDGRHSGCRCWKVRRGRALLWLEAVGEVGYRDSAVGEEFGDTIFRG
jgi:hypothetical protein